jgi:hypothetical protein
MTSRCKLKNLILWSFNYYLFLIVSIYVNQVLVFVFASFSFSLLPKLQAQDEHYIFISFFLSFILSFSQELFITLMKLFFTEILIQIFLLGLLSMVATILVTMIHQMEQQVQALPLHVVQVTINY